MKLSDEKLLEDSPQTNERAGDYQCNTFEDLFAVATVSRKAVNQDAVVVLKDSKGHEVGIAIADGIGSHFGADVASATTVKILANMVGALPQNESAELQPMIETIKGELDELALAARASVQGFDESNSFGTTLVLAMAEREQWVVSYLGNGAAFHLRGDFAESCHDGAFPWSGVNLLGPHSKLIKGKNVLARYLGPGLSIKQSRPTTLRISRDLDDTGDIVLLCSDGLHSADQLQFGIDDQGKKWSGENPLLSKLITDLDLSLQQGVKTSEDLYKFLKEYLSSLLAENLIDDDCSIGLAISARVIARYANQKGGTHQ